MKGFRWIIWMLVIIFLLFILGCETKIKPVPATTAGSAALIKLVDQNWVVTSGIVLCVIGVFTFLNGGTKGVSFVGAGLAAIALGGVVAAYFAVLADYKGWILIGFGILITIGVIAFIRTAAADVNKDGKVNWKDIKDLFRKQ